MKTVENAKKNFIVVGGDSFLGTSLISQLKGKGHNVVGTTRRKETLSNDKVFLDIREPDNFQIPEGVDCVFIVAGITNYGQCETDPEAWGINVESIPHLAARFMKAGSFVYFTSTNSVFGGDHPWPGEDDPHFPNIAYSRQKSESEVAIQNHAKKLDCLEQLGIVRLTKIVAPSTLPFPKWLEEWKNDHIVTPFEDLIFAPISLGFAARNLAILGENPIAGNFHLSGAKNITYCDFARALAKKMGISDFLIAPTTSLLKGVKVLYLPKYSGIGMLKTSKLAGIAPESLDSVVATFQA